MFSLAVEGCPVSAFDGGDAPIVAGALAVGALVSLFGAAVWRHEWSHTGSGEVLDLLTVPVASVGEHDIDLFADICRGQFLDGGVVTASSIP